MEKRPNYYSDTYTPQGQNLPSPGGMPIVYGANSFTPGGPGAGAAENKIYQPSIFGSDVVPEKGGV
jgi:hypothetical protein